MTTNPMSEPEWAQTLRQVAAATSLHVPWREGERMSADTWEECRKACGREMVDVTRRLQGEAFRPGVFDAAMDAWEDSADAEQIRRAVTIAESALLGATNGVDVLCMALSAQRERFGADSVRRWCDGLGAWSKRNADERTHRRLLWQALHAIGQIIAEMREAERAEAAA